MISSELIEALAKDLNQFLQRGKDSIERSSPVILSAAKDQRSEASRCRSRETLRFAQGDMV